jgi:putative ABC transport system permease protein
MTNLLNDVKQALRSIRKSPVTIGIAILSMALGIGATTAIFTVMNQVLARSMPFPDLDRLVMVWEASPARGVPQRPVRAANFVDWRERTHVFEDIAWSMDNAPYFLTGSGEPQSVLGYRFSANMFKVLGVEPLIGRTFSADEDKPGNDNVVVLAYSFWQEKFGGDRSVLGRTINLSGRSYTVIGVMPAGFKHPNFSKLWTPIALNAEQFAERRNGRLRLVGKLRPGVSREEAERQLNAAAAQIAQEHPDTNKDWQTTVRSLRDSYTGDIRPILYALFFAVLILLLIACTNVANLLLTKGSERRREFSVRVALGASRARLIRQILTESLVLSTVGGAIGLLLAVWGTRLLLRMFPNNIANLNIPKIEALPIDSTVVWFCLGATLLTGLLFGLLPALQTSGKDVVSGLRDSSISFTASKRGRRIRNALVVAEICMALVLVTGAGLAIKSYNRLSAARLGFEPDGVLTFYTWFPQYKYPDGNARRVYFDHLLNSVANVHGVEQAGAISFLPLSSFGAGLNFTVQGREFTPGSEPESDLNVATPGYFQAMHIPLIAGRDFAVTDTPVTDTVSRPEVGIVNQTFVKKFFANEDPIGKRLNVGNQQQPEWVEIIGVVSDVKSEAVDVDIVPMLYLSFDQSPSRFMAFTLRTKGDPYALLPDVRQAIWSVDKDQPIERILSMNDATGESFAVRKITTSIMTMFGTISMALACIGIYGVIAFSVVQRTHEFGIRMALGAAPERVLGMVLADAIKLGIMGIALGLIAAFLLSRFADAIAYGISTRDPLTFVGTAVLLGSTALVAALIPAWRASRVEPSIALRRE